MTLASKEDQSAQEQIENYNKVHSLLAHGKAQSPEDIALEADLDRVTVSKAINYLQNLTYIEQHGAGTWRQYQITALGQLNAPAPKVPNFRSKECDPRKKKQHKPKLASNRPRISGHRHFDGVVGKFPVDTDGAILLGSTSNLGMVYFALKGEMTANDLQDKAEIDSQPIVWTACRTLLRMGLFTFDEGAKPRLYRKTSFLVRPLDAPTPPQSKPAPKASIEIKPADTPAQAPTQAVSSTFEPAPKPLLERDLDALLERHNLADVLFACFVRMETEYSRLSQLHDKLQQVQLDKGK